MIEAKRFRERLKENTTYRDAVIGDIVFRVKRADGALAWSDEDAYQFYLEQTDKFKSSTVSVRSQIKKAVKPYGAFNKAAKT